MENKFESENTLVDISHNATPYCIRFKNTSKEVKKCVFLGYSVFIGQENFGNPKEVEITNLVGSTYGHVLSEIALNPLKTGMLRIHGQKLIDKFQLTHHNAKGAIYQKTELVIVDPYLFQANIAQLTKEHTIDGNTYFAFELEAEQELTFTLYPQAQVNLSRLLTGIFNVFTAAMPKRMVLQRVKPKYPVLFYLKTKWNQFWHWMFPKKHPDGPGLGSYNMAGD